MPNKISNGSGYGGRPYVVGETLVPRKTEPVTVLTARQTYYREDGLSFGVGDESGYVYSATVRAATPAEVEAALVPIHEQALRLDAAHDLREVDEAVCLVADRPAGRENIPEGQTLLDTRTIYGGGSWWVVGPEWIWSIKNNGADGDDWSYNNIRTGGAGAIGCRVPYREDLHRELLRLEEALGLREAREEAEAKAATEKIARERRKKLAERAGEVIYVDERRRAEITKLGGVRITNLAANKWAERDATAPFLPLDSAAIVGLKKAFPAADPAEYRRWDSTGLILPVAVAVAVEKLSQKIDG